MLRRMTALSSMNRLLVGCSCLALPALALLFMGCGGEARDEAQEGAQEGAQNGASSPAVRALRTAFAERAPEVLQQEHAFKRTERGFTLKDPGAEGTWRSIEAELPREGQGQVLARAPAPLVRAPRPAAPRLGLRDVLRRDPEDCVVRSLPRRPAVLTSHHVAAPQKRSRPSSFGNAIQSHQR